jgi:hypothetical protein
MAWLESEPSDYTPKLLGTHLIAQRTRREVGVPDIPGAMALTTAVQLPCALLASGACTLLVATHHIHPHKPLV